ncbi:MAG: LPS-assembly protein LptD [Candidatus Omnitrophica bacterium]|nr:LPS-assembly protein LptD [Candidatus Omnitrophota bacterium]
MAKNLFKIVSFICALLMCAHPSFAQFNFSDRGTNKDTNEKVEVTADQVEYDNNAKKIIGRGNVVIVHGKDRLIADYAEVYNDTKEAMAEGHVILFQGENQLRGDKVFYNFESNSGHFPDGAYKANPFYGNAQDIKQINQDKVHLQNAFLTTCDLGFRPHYGAQAKKVIIYFDDKLIATNCKIKILGKTVMWWPYMLVPLHGKHMPLSVRPGYSSDWGAYVLTKKGFSINKNINGAVRYDYRYERGHAGGADLNYNYGQFGTGLFRAYVAHDLQAPDKSLADPESADITDDRYRFRWQHRTDIDEYTNVIVEYNKLHDEYFLNDFFENEYKAEADPETFAILTRNTERYGFLVNVEKRANHFLNTIEKLPEVRFNWNNQEVFNTNIYYENETSVVNFHNKRAHSALDDDVVRLDFYNKISYPVKLFRYNFLPYFYSRHDYYSKNSSGKENITRGAYGGGIDVNTRYFKVYDVTTDVLGIDINQIRHILEPSIGYISTREVTVPRNTLFQLDEIDAEDDFDEVTFGIRNKLQTKREVDGQMKRVDLFVLDNKINYEFNREAAGGSSWLNFSTEVELRPYNWMMLYHKNVWDIRRDQFDSSDFAIELTPLEKWKFLLNHGFIDDKLLGDNDEASSLLTFDTEYKINDLWKVGGYVRYEFDDSRAEEMELRLLRDLHCWLLEFGVNQRNNEGDERETEFFFDLKMKAFPDIEAKTGNRSTYSRGRYGALISGSSG